MFFRQRILSLAYNRAAKDELISRTKAFGEFRISTMHGLALEIVRGNARKLGFTRRPEVAESDPDGDLLFKLVKQKLSTTAATNREISYVVRQIEKARQQVTTGLFDPSVLTDEFVVGSRGSGLRNTAPVGIGKMIDETVISLRQIAEEYEAMKKGMGVLDFQDMLLMAGHLLESDEDVRNLYHEKYPFVQVDEFQDISPADWRLIKNLSPNLFAVGDDDQAIYGSLRGGTGDVMREFSDVAKQYEILRNFRSTPEIVDVSREFIEGSPGDRLPKGLISGRESGSPVRHVGASRHDVIPKLLEEIRKGGETAILARENDEIKWLKSQLPDDVLSGIEFSTIHSSKGREWERVLLPLNVTERGGEEYQSLPGQSTEAMQLQEDRNLLYVAMTRAKNELVTFGDQYQHLFPQHERAVVTPIGSDKPVSVVSDDTPIDDTQPITTDTNITETITDTDDVPPKIPIDDTTAATDDVKKVVENVQKHNDNIIGASEHLKEGWKGLYHRFRAHYQRVRAYQDMVNMERKGAIPDVEVYENLTAATLHRQKIEEIGKWIGLEPAPSGKRPTKLRAIDRMLAFLGNPRGMFITSGIGTGIGSSLGMAGAGHALWSSTGIFGMMPFGLQKLSRRFDAAMYPASRRPTYDLNLDYSGHDKITDEVLSVLPDDILESALDFEGQLRNYRIVQAKMAERQFSETYFEFPDPEMGWEGSHVDRPIFDATGLRMTRVTVDELDELNRQGAELSEYFAYDTGTDTRDPEVRVRKYEPYGWSGDPYTRPKQGRTPLGLEQPANFFLEEFVSTVRENLEGTRKPDIPKDFLSVFRHLKRQMSFLKVWRKNHKALIKRVQKFQNWYTSNVEGLEGDAHKQFIEREYLPKLNKLLGRLYPDRSKKGGSSWFSTETGDFGKHAVRLTKIVEKDLHDLHLEVMDAVDEVWSQDSPYYKSLNWVYANSGPFELPDGTQSEITPLVEPFQRAERAVKEAVNIVKEAGDATTDSGSRPKRSIASRLSDVLGMFNNKVEDFNKSAVRLLVSDAGIETGQFGDMRISSGVYLGDRRVLVTLHQIVDEIIELRDEAGKILTDDAGKAITDRFRPHAISAAGMGLGDFTDVIGVDFVDVENELAVLRLAEDIDAIPAQLASGMIQGEQLRGRGIRSADSRQIDYTGRLGQRGGLLSSIFGSGLASGQSGTGVFNTLGELVGLLSAGHPDSPRSFIRDASAISGLSDDAQQYFSLEDFLKDVNLSNEDLKQPLVGQIDEFVDERGLMTGDELNKLLGLKAKSKHLENALAKARSEDAPLDVIGEYNRAIEKHASDMRAFGLAQGEVFLKRRDALVQELLPKYQELFPMYDVKYQELADKFPTLNRDELLALFEDRVGRSDLFDLPNLIDPSLRGDLLNLNVGRFSGSFRAGQHVSRIAGSDRVSGVRRLGAKALIRGTDVVEPMFRGLIEGIDSLKRGGTKVGDLSGIQKVGRIAGRVWDNPFSKVLRKGAKKAFIALEILDIHDKAQYFTGRREFDIASQALGEGEQGAEQFVNVLKWLDKSPELKEIIETGVVPEGLSAEDMKVVEEGQKVYGEAAEGVKTSFDTLVERRKVLESELSFGRDITAEGDNFYHSRLGSVWSGHSPLDEDYLRSESEEFLWWDIPNWVGGAIRFLDSIEKVTPSKFMKGLSDPSGEVHFSSVKDQLEEVNKALEHDAFKGMDISDKDREQRVVVLSSRLRSNKQLIERLKTGDYGGFGFGSENERREKAFKYSQEMSQEYVDQLTEIDKIIEPLHKAYGYEGDFRSPEYKRKLQNLSRVYEKDPQTGFMVGGYRDVITEESGIYKKNVPVFDFRKLRKKIGFNVDDSWSHLDVMRNQQMLSLLDERQRIVDKQVVLPTQQIENLEKENREITNIIKDISHGTTSVGSAREFEIESMRKYKANQAQQVVSPVMAARRDSQVTEVIDAVTDANVSEVLAAKPDDKISRDVRKLTEQVNLTNKSESEQKRILNEFVEKKNIDVKDRGRVVDEFNEVLGSEFKKDDIKKPIIEKSDVSNLVSTFGDVGSSDILPLDFTVSRPKGKFLGLFDRGREALSGASPEFIRQYISESGDRRKMFRPTPKSVEELKEGGSYVVIKSLEDVIDADTVKGTIHHEGKTRDSYVRFEGIDAAELDPAKKYRYDKERPAHMIERERERGLLAQRELRAIIQELNEGRTTDLILPLDMASGMWKVGDFGRTLATPNIPGIDYYDALIENQWAKVYKSPADVGHEYVDKVKARYTRAEWDKAQRFSDSLDSNLLKLISKESAEASRSQILHPAQVMESDLQSLLSGELLKGKDVGFRDYLEGFRGDIRKRISDTQKNILDKRADFVEKREAYVGYSLGGPSTTSIFT